MIPITFNYENFCNCIDQIRSLRINEELDLQTIMNRSFSLTYVLRDELNKLFTDAKCTEVTISENTDKPFFGIRVRPVKCDERLFSLINNYSRLVGEQGQGSYMINSYAVDIDSKLLYAGNITTNGLAKLLIMDIDNVLSADTVTDLIAAIDAALEDNNITLIDAAEYIKQQSDAAYLYAMYETIYKMRSICAKSKDALIVPNEILKWEKCMAPSEDVSSATYAFDDAVEVVRSLQDDMARYACPTLILNWFFMWAKDLKPQNTYPIKLLTKAKAMEGSELMKRALNRAIERLGGGPATYRNEKVVCEAKKGLVAQMKYSGMKSLEDDLFEYSMRIKNVDDENSAILLMRQINSRMGIISDYLETEGENINEAELHRWEKLYDKYDKLRDQMVAKPIYSRKMYGLFVDYNALMANNNQNMMTMNTMY